MTESEEKREKESVGKNKREILLLVHSPDVYNSLDWAGKGQEPETPSRSVKWMAVIQARRHYLLPSRVHISRKLNQKKRWDLIPCILIFRHPK